MSRGRFASAILLFVLVLAPARADEPHWAFRPPARPGVPRVKDPAAARNPIDAFVAAEHERLGLVARPEAPKHVLLRRLYLDLAGLPPTREELHAFLADESPDAYEQAVDRLLASPQYGQRWGRHWMDIWRYSDWAGYAAEVRESRPFVWRWRDWIVESLNADKPYDRMVLEMLAGDEVAPEDPGVLRATGFLARNWYKFNRNVWLENTVEHTSKAFLGLTINCARCHDHKYDPVSQKEHYRFRAFFEPYDVRTDRVPGEPDTKKDGVVRAFDADGARKTFLFLRGDEKSPLETEPLAPGVPAALGSGDGDVAVTPVAFPATSYYQGLRPWVREEAKSSAAGLVAAAEKGVNDADAHVAAAQKQLDEVLARASRPQSEHRVTHEAGTDQPSTAAALFDDFSAARPDLWKTANGQWTCREGKLVQTEAGETFRTATSLADHPRDFRVRVAVTITGGTKYCSVGIGFDSTDDGRNGASVYLSAHAAGPAVAIMWTDGGTHVYPPNGATHLPVELNKPYELRVDARGQLLNVYVDNVPVKAFALARPRAGGKLAVWTFDASAEFDRVRVDPLPADARLVEKLEGTPALRAASGDAFAASRVALEKAQAAAVLARLQLAAARAERAALDAKLDADTARYATPPSGDAPALAAVAGRAEREAAVWRQEATVLQAESTSKSDAEKKTLAESKKKLEEARAKLKEPAKDYTPLTPVNPSASTGRRLALAKWITDPSNPLAARVVANHLWARHFGEGIVSTVFDFGKNGRPPTHPGLLDWLAVELRDNGWSMKRMHRLIVTSATYRMDSGDGPDGGRNLAVDPDNRFLWHAPVRRMEAELVRDAVLHVAGNLDPAAGGPELDPAAGLTTHRRSLYFRHAHEKQMTFLRLFDAAGPGECYRRQHSVIPQQALALANSPLAIAQARVLARKLAGEADFVAAAFEQALGRRPTEAERATCDEFLKRQAFRLSDPAKLTAFTAGDKPAVEPSPDPARRARENLVHVLLNHNDFVTIR